MNIKYFIKKLFIILFKKGSKIFPKIKLLFNQKIINLKNKLKVNGRQVTKKSSGNQVIMYLNLIALKIQQH